MRIRVTTRADLFEERKRQHIERGYHIEEECSLPVNGFCSFIAVKDMPVSDMLAERVAELLTETTVRVEIGECSMSLKIRFRFDGKCSVHPRYNPERDGRPRDGKCEGCESLYVIHLYTRIANRRAENANLIVMRATRDRDEQDSSNKADTNSETGVDP